MRTRSFRRYAVAALSVAALAAVSGCGTDVHPGQAAVVDGTNISMSDADSFSDDFCELYRPILKQQKSALSMATVRALALDVLVRDELVHQYAEDRGWTPPASYHKAVHGIDDQVEQYKSLPTTWRPSAGSARPRSTPTGSSQGRPGGWAPALTRRPRSRRAARPSPTTPPRPMSPSTPVSAPCRRRGSTSPAPVASPSR